MLDLQRRKKSKKRSISRSLIKLPSCKIRSNQSNTLLLLNSITWSVNEHPENATNKISSNFLYEPWCSGEIRILAPVVKDDPTTTVLFYHELVIRKKQLKLFDILYRIHNFYVYETLLPEDLIVANVVNSMKRTVNGIVDEFGESVFDVKAKLTGTGLNFFRLLIPQTNFSGLVHQKENVYILKLV